MTDRVRAVAFDVNETLFRLDAVASRLHEVGLGTDSLELWFTRILRDGFAAAAAGSFAAFPDLARHHLRELARSRAVELPEGAADRVIGGFQEVEAHRDVEPTFRRLAKVGVRIVTLTNGTAAITRSFLEREGLDGLVERVFEVAEVGLWKPRPEPYRFVADELGVEARELALVAAHPWDVHGARAAGLVAGWVNRAGGAYPDSLAAPDVEGTSLYEVTGPLASG